jgi:hypothetical protein
VVVLILPEYDLRAGERPDPILCVAVEVVDALVQQVHRIVNDHDVESRQIQLRGQVALMARDRRKMVVGEHPVAAVSRKGVDVIGNRLGAAAVDAGEEQDLKRLAIGRRLERLSRLSGIDCRRRVVCIRRRQRGNWIDH